MRLQLIAADTSLTLTMWQRSSFMREMMSWPVGHHFEIMTLNQESPSADVHLLEEHSCQISPRFDLKWAFLKRLSQQKEDK